MSKNVIIETTSISSESIFSRIGRYSVPMFLALFDYGAIVLSILFAEYIRGDILLYFVPSLEPFHVNNTYTYIIVPIIYLFFLAYGGLYNKRLPLWKSAEVLFKACTYVSALMIVVMYFMKEADVSRIFVCLSWFISFICLVIARYTVKRLLLSGNLWQKPIIVVGAGKTAELLANSFTKDGNLGYKIVGVIEDNCKNKPLTRVYPHVGTFDNADAVIMNSAVEDIIIAVPGLERSELLSLIYRIQPCVKNITIVPDLFGVPLSNMEVEALYNEQTIMLRMKNNLSYWRNRVAKRMFDIVTGIAVLLMVIPVLLLIGIAIKSDSKGPVFHVAKRLGKKGKLFWCFKFRTMYPNADAMLADYFAQSPEAKEEWDKYAKIKGYDPRITKVGIWLRKYSLDELPQIFNVIIGNMSLVGPRPYLPRERARMGYMAHAILETVPGVTGLWQVSGRNEIEFEGRLKMDSWYVRNWSLWQDIVLLLKTLDVVLNKRGAY
ncbi:undecaprenyl-phosphate galactose phosphotransferase WbaP [Propionispora hippei]|nr:undecaprenyl-phosphate galactose phosphotransferase WbaP [Propionispora hippei]